MSLAAWLVGLTAVIAWFVAAATAIQSVSRIWLRHWAQGRARVVRAVALYLSRPDQLLLTAGLAVTAAAGGVGAALGARGGTASALALRLALAAAAVLIAGQVIPRAVARRWARPLVPVLLPSVQVAALIATPLFLLVRGLGIAVRRARRTPYADPAARAEEAVDAVFRDGAREGVSVPTDASIVSGVVRLADRMVRDVMTPRAEVFAVDAAMPARAMTRAIAGAGYSRVPVCRGSFDEVIGMVHVFDVFTTRPDAPLRFRPVASARDQQSCSDVMFAMLREHRHLAIVADGGGRNVGIVTLEDLLETVVGEIRDEHDDA